jgi:mersacidin/lichenicidin family type 2 lantibiotic
MENYDVVRAWKDEDYRLSLPPEVLASMPASPAGPTRLPEGEMAGISDGLTGDGLEQYMWSPTLNPFTCSSWVGTTCPSTCGLTDDFNQCPTMRCNTVQTQCS